MLSELSCLTPKIHIRGTYYVYDGAMEWEHLSSSIIVCLIAAVVIASEFPSVNSVQGRTSFFPPQLLLHAKGRRPRSVIIFR